MATIKCTHDFFLFRKNTCSAYRKLIEGSLPKDCFSLEILVQCDRAVGVNNLVWPCHNCHYLIHHYSDEVILFMVPMV